VLDLGPGRPWTNKQKLEYVRNIVVKQSMKNIFGCVHGWIPVLVVENDGVGAGQVDAKPTTTSAQNKTKNLGVAVETVHEPLPTVDSGTAVQPKVCVAI